jgi:hypothetical protein
VSSGARKAEDGRRLELSSGAHISDPLAARTEGRGCLGAGDHLVGKRLWRTARCGMYLSSEVGVLERVRPGSLRARFVLRRIPVVVATRKAFTEAQRNAFELARKVGGTTSRERHRRGVGT